MATEKTFITVRTTMDVCIPNYEFTLQLSKDVYCFFDDLYIALNDCIQKNHLLYLTSHGLINELDSESGLDFSFEVFFGEDDERASSSLTIHQCIEPDCYLVDDEEYGYKVDCDLVMAHIDGAIVDSIKKISKFI